MDILTVTPNDLHMHWPTITPALDIVRAECNETWINEDVYHAIKIGGATAHLIYEHGQYASLFVLCGEQDEYSKEWSLLIWIAHNVGSDAAYTAGLEAIKAIARERRLRLFLKSPRLGWQKRFRLVSATYEVPL